MHLVSETFGQSVRAVNRGVPDSDTYDWAQCGTSGSQAITFIKIISNYCKQHFTCLPGVHPCSQQGLTTVSAATWPP